MRISGRLVHASGICEAGFPLRSTVAPTWLSTHPVDKSLRELITVHEAEKAIAEASLCTHVTECAFDDAIGRILAGDVFAADHIPPFDNSAMDGYAVRFEDTLTEDVRLSVVADIPAGSWSTHTIGRGECARIMTGAPMPAGADTVVPVELTTELDRHAVRIDRVPESRQHVRYRGEDIQPGAVVLKAGTRVTPPVIGMLATVGVSRIPVYERPKVAVIATGDELIDVTASLAPGKIRNSNGPALTAQAEILGADVRPPVVARDDHDDMDERLREAMNADVIVISGGVSVGEHDHVKDVIERAGFELVFWRVRQKPGKPLVFAKMEEKLLFGLPGNPVSASVCFERYVRPAILRKMGHRRPERSLEPAILKEPISKKPGLYYFTRGEVAYAPEGHLETWSTGPQGSNLYSSVVSADCLIHLSEQINDPPAGTRVFIERLGWQA